MLQNISAGQNGIDRKLWMIFEENVHCSLLCRRRVKMSRWWSLMSLSRLNDSLRRNPHLRFSHVNVPAAVPDESCLYTDVQLDDEAWGLKEDESPSRMIQPLSVVSSVQ